MASVSGFFIFTGKEQDEQDRLRRQDNLRLSCRRRRSCSSCSYFPTLLIFCLSLFKSLLPLSDLAGNEQSLSASEEVEWELDENDSIASSHNRLTEFIEDHFSDFLKNLLGESIFDISGYHCFPTQNGVYGEGELHDKVRVTLINGILNFPKDHSGHLLLFSAAHANINIHYIFRPCEGWSRDMVRCIFSKAGIISDQAELLANTWKKLIDEMGGVSGEGTIVHYAHSIGGTETYAAKNLLSPEEQRMIKVITIGSPTLIPPGGFKDVVNYVSRRDGVCLLDLFTFIQGCLDPSLNIIYLDTFLGVPLIDHPLSAPSYSAIIEELGKNFIAEYCNNPVF